MRFLAALMARMGHLTYHSAEAIGKVFSHGPRALGSAMKAAGGLGRRQIGKAFQAGQSGIYHAAEGIGKAVEDPIGTGKALYSGAKNMATRAWQSPQRQAVGQYFANYGPHISNAWQHTKTIGSNVGHWLGNKLGGKHAGPMAAMGAGFLSLGMKSLGAGVKATGGLFKALSAPVGGLAKSIGLLRQFASPTALLGATYGLKMFVERIINSNRQLAKWNGQLAASFAQLDVKQMRLDIQTANASSGTGSQLNSAYGELLQELQPLREDLTVFMNLVAINLVQGSRSLVQMIKAAADANGLLREVLEGLHVLEEEAKDKNKPDVFPGNAALNALAGMQPAADRQPIGPRRLLDPRIAENDPAQRAIGDRILRGQM